MILKALPLVLTSDSAIGRSETLETLAAGAHAVHLHSMLDMKLQVVLSNTRRARKWTDAACAVQRCWRFKRFAVRVEEDLHQRRDSNPMLLVLSDALHMHSIGKFYKVS